MRRLLTSTLFAALLPGMAVAQDRPSLLDYFSLDVIVQRILQSGVLALRTQLDMKYSDMSVDLRTGAITITDLRAWPLPEWDVNNECEIAIDRVTIRSGALDEPTRLRFKAQAINASFGATCLPPDAREPLDMIGMGEVSMPRITMDVDYGVPASDAVVRMYSEITDVAAIDLTANMAYFWFDGRDDIEEPLPVIFLDDATLTIENLGLWQKVSPMMPLPMTGPGSGQFMQGMLGEQLLDMNSKAGDEAEQSLTQTQRDFIASVASAWAGFVEKPEVLVLETNIPGDTFVDLEVINEDPRAIFDTFAPRLALAPASRSKMIPVALLRQALGPEAAQLSAEDRRRIGIALVNGEGAPRNVEAGFGLLNPMARGGDGAAAAVMSDALETRAPEDAYRWALLAGAAGEVGATARLDRLERNLPFARVLELQTDVSGGDQHSPDKLANIGLIREQAANRLSGRGLARSYGIAAMWAMIAKAAGDPEAGDILSDIDERVRLAGPDAQAPWSAAEDKASKLAMDAWIGQDLPARYGN